MLLYQYRRSMNYKFDLNTFPIWVIEYAKEMKTEIGQKNRFLAYVLLRELLAFVHFDQPIEFYKDQFGKPFLRNSSIYFNISHSDDMVFVAVSDKRIGVDVERKRRFDSRIAERYFVHSNVNDDDSFTKAFVKMESYGKMLGTGIKKDLPFYEKEIQTFSDNGYYYAICLE